MFILFFIFIYAVSFQVITELATSPTIIGAIEERFDTKNVPGETHNCNKTTFVTDSLNGSQTCALELPEENALCMVELHESNKKDHVSQAENVNISMDDSSITSDIAHKFYDKSCTECHIRRRDPTPCELTMCLHALSYKVRRNEALCFIEWFLLVLLFLLLKSYT